MSVYIVRRRKDAGWAWAERYEKSAGKWADLEASRETYRFRFLAKRAARRARKAAEGKGTQVVR